MELKKVQNHPTTSRPLVRPRILNSNFDDGTRSTALPLRRQLVSNIINAKQCKQKCKVHAMIISRVYAMVR